MSLAIMMLFWGLAVMCWAYALRYGGSLARWAFVLFILAMIGTTLATPSHTGKDLWTGTNWPLFATDFGYFLGLFGLMMFSRRYWTIWAAAFQLACVLSHFGPILDPTTNPRLYRMLESAWMVPMLVTMVLGISKDRRHDGGQGPIVSR